MSSGPDWVYATFYASTSQSPTTIHYCCTTATRTQVGELLATSKLVATSRLYSNYKYITYRPCHSRPRYRREFGELRWGPNAKLYQEIKNCQKLAGLFHYGSPYNFRRLGARETIRSNHLTRHTLGNFSSEANDFLAAVRVEIESAN